MKIKTGFLLREVDGTAIVVAVGPAAKNFNGMITLNEVGAFLWKKIEKGTDSEELVSSLLAEYEVERSVAEADVTAFTENLRKAGVLDE